MLVVQLVKGLLPDLFVVLQTIRLYCLVVYWCCRQWKEAVLLVLFCAGVAANQDSAAVLCVDVAGNESSDAFFCVGHVAGHVAGNASFAASLGPGMADSGGSADFLCAAAFTSCAAGHKVP